VDASLSDNGRIAAGQLLLASPFVARTPTSRRTVVADRRPPAPTERWAVVAQKPIDVTVAEGAPAGAGCRRHASSCMSGGPVQGELGSLVSSAENPRSGAPPVLVARADSAGRGRSELDAALSGHRAFALFAGFAKVGREGQLEGEIRRRATGSPEVFRTMFSPRVPEAAREATSSRARGQASSALVSAGGCAGTQSVKDPGAPAYSRWANRFRSTAAATLAQSLGPPQAKHPEDSHMLKLASLADKANPSKSCSAWVVPAWSQFKRARPPNKKKKQNPKHKKKFKPKHIKKSIKTQSITHKK